MSRRSKGIQTGKILEMLEKADLDDAIDFYKDLKEQLTIRLEKAAEDLELKQGALLEIKEKL